MRKAVSLALFAIFAFASSCTLAGKYDLPEDPIGEISLEMADASAVVTGDYRGIDFVSIELSDNAWGDYVGVNAAMRLPGDSWFFSADMQVWTDSDGNLNATYDRSMDYFRQGKAEFTITASDGSITEDFSRYLPVGSGLSGDPYLSVHNRSAANPADTGIHVCDLTGYSIAVSEAKDFIFLKPVDAYSAGRYVGLTIFNTATVTRASRYDLGDNGIYYCVLGPADFQEGKWTKIPVSYFVSLNPSITFSSRTVAQIRSGWTFHAWSSSMEAKSWGTDIRTHITGAGFTATEPAAGDVFDPLAARSMGGLGAGRQCSALFLDLFAPDRQAAGF